mmetsp:Transcript_28770/g.58801  ORF Transcript_28770/g.58801 Transcript_28770/m.58801 type:complete len:537 (+) Transcript_28770:125-1735(+)
MSWSNLRKDGSARTRSVGASMRVNSPAMSSGSSWGSMRALGFSTPPSPLLSACPPTLDWGSITSSFGRSRSDSTWWAHVGSGSSSQQQLVLPGRSADFPALVVMFASTMRVGSSSSTSLMASMHATNLPAMAGLEAGLVEDRLCRARPQNVFTRAEPSSESTTSTSKPSCFPTAARPVASRAVQRLWSAKATCSRVSKSGDFALSTSKRMAPGVRMICPWFASSVVRLRRVAATLKLKLGSPGTPDSAKLHTACTTPDCTITSWRWMQRLTLHKATNVSAFAVASLRTVDMAFRPSMIPPSMSLSTTSSCGTVATTKHTFAQWLHVSMSCGSAMCFTRTGMPLACSSFPLSIGLHTSKLRNALTPSLMVRWFSVRESTSTSVSTVPPSVRDLWAATAQVMLQSAKQARLSNASTSLLTSLSKPSNTSASATNSASTDSEVETLARNRTKASLVLMSGCFMSCLNTDRPPSVTSVNSWPPSEERLARLLAKSTRMLTAVATCVMALSMGATWLSCRLGCIDFWQLKLNTAWTQIWWM